MRTGAKRIVCFLLGLTCLAAAIPPNSEFRVRLLSPISTMTNQEGDTITAQVLSPAEFEGGILEGEIKRSKGGNKVKGKAQLNFTFHTLEHNGQRIGIQSSVKSITNSKGQPDVDEEGHLIKRKNNLGKTAAATGLGALVGAMAGGAKGAAIGAGIGAAGSLVLVKLTAKGAQINLAPGSELVLSVDEARR